MVQNALVATISEAAMTEPIREQLRERKQIARQFLERNFPPGNHGFWNWKTVDELDALLGAMPQAVAER